MRATMAEKAAFAISIVTSVPVKSQERFSIPPGGGDVVPDRPDDVVTAENNEIKNAGEEERADFVWANVDRFVQESECAIHPG